MIKTINLYLLTSLIIGEAAWAKDPYVDIDTTMCRAGETIYISCALDGGPDEHDYDGPVASICAKNNVSPETGYVQYRYGLPIDGRQAQKLEMQFPEKKSPPKEKFKIYESNNLESVAVALRFTNGKYTYSFESYGLGGYKVVARESDREVFSKSCTLPGVNYLVDKAYQGIERINFDQQKIPGTNE
ncbi:MULTISPECIES: hypothetical protein [unclassified Pseudomonas]|uniref:hypothetical protein n=1 Tax=unclassified Pseudomonas TaxID=196821 RepID=UPI001CBCDC98|nr:MULTISPECIES: hypothetical protein [unclassified Pseudomonas]